MFLEPGDLKLVQTSKVINTSKLFRWSIGGNISKNQNKVLSFDAGADASEAASYNDTRSMLIEVSYWYQLFSAVIMGVYDEFTKRWFAPIWLDQNGKQTESYSDPCQ